jgi:hypothetical protein
MAEVSRDDVLKALVDAELGRNPHPDTAAVLSEWREDNTSEEERRAKLSDDERAAEDREEAEDNRRFSGRRANQGGTESRAATADESASGPDSDDDKAADRGAGKSDKGTTDKGNQPGTEGASRDDDKPKSGTRK